MTKPRAGGVSKLRGRKAVKVTATVIGTLVAARLVWPAVRLTRGQTPVKA